MVGVTKQKPVIGMDADDFLLDWSSPFLLWHNITYGTRLKKEDWNTFDMSKVLGCSKKEAESRVYAFYQTDICMQIKPNPGAVEGVARIAEDYRLFVVTSRSEKIKDITYAQLEYFSKAFYNVFFSQHSHFTGNGSTKTEICLQQGAKILGEDGLQYAIEAASKGIRVVLLDQPWNRPEKPEELPPGITRAYSWPGIVETVCRIP